MPNRLPAGLKIAYLLWMAVWVPTYWVANGPANFLWICDFAMFVTGVGLLRESKLLLSSQLVATVIIQAVWTVDFFSRLLLGFHPFQATAYMFREETAIFVRSFSLFHLWTVPLLWWCLRRLGYDRRGVRLQAAFTVLLFPAGQWLGTQEQNLNWMWGLGEGSLPVHPLLWTAIGVLMVPWVLYVPGDWVARRWLRLRDPSHASPMAATTSASSMASDPFRAKRSGSNS